MLEFKKFLFFTFRFFRFTEPLIEPLQKYLKKTSIKGHHYFPW
jgi:hypothetical protein